MVDCSAASKPWVHCFYPTEYLTYGGRSANITTHPNGTQEYRIADHLGSNRVTLENTGSVVTTTDYEPFGKAIAGVPPRKGFIDKEKDQESGLGDFGVRKYDDGIGRFLSPDPLAEKMPSWSPYVYSFNNPLTLIDPNGQYPWSFHIRSFISTPTAGLGYFRGDGRGPSLVTDDENVTSRVRSKFIVDPAKGSISDFFVDSDESMFYGALLPSPFGIIRISPTFKEGTPKATISNKSFSKGSASFDFHHFGKDPITPGFLTPPLNLHSSLSVQEDLKKGILSISGSFTGDIFPSAEAFVVDQGGTKVFLGAKMEFGNELDLYGDNKKPLFDVNLQIRFDDSGNFTEVLYGGMGYTISDWNNYVQNNF